MVGKLVQGIACGIAAAVCYGMNPLGARALYARGFTPDSALFYRYGFAVLLLGIWVAARRESFRIGWREFGILAGLGALFSVSSLTFFESFCVMDTGLACTLLFVYPLMVAVIMALCFGERLTKATVAALALALGGIALLCGGAGLGARRDCPALQDGRRRRERAGRRPGLYVGPHLCALYHCVEPRGLADVGGEGDLLCDALLPALCLSARMVCGPTPAAGPLYAGSRPLDADVGGGADGALAGADGDGGAPGGLHADGRHGRIGTCWGWPSWAKRSQRASASASRSSWVRSSSSPSSAAAPNKPNPSPHALSVTAKTQMRAKPDGLTPVALLAKRPPSVASLR